ncbi:TAP-like protein-domain-containing protein [Mycena polygramma]|nr:TAP-like protein-domain-containing protein [Mycena polygramma]
MSVPASKQMTVCPFYAASASEIASKLDALTNSILEQPIPVITPTSYGIVDFTFLRNAILDTLFGPYEPVSGFVSLGQGLAALAAGNASVLYSRTAEPTFECQASPPAFHLNNFEAYVAIACGDATPVNDTVAELQEYWLNGTRVSQFSDLFASQRVLCASYKIHRQGRFVGPVGAKNTSFPLLLVGNSLDPGTSHAGALQTSEAFPGSVVLTQDCVGHTSLVAPSLCSYGHFKAYFLNGTLPAPGAVCPVDADLFPSSSATNGTARRGLRTLEEQELLDAGWKIGSVVRKVIRLFYTFCYAFRPHFETNSFMVIAAGKRKPPPTREVDLVYVRFLGLRFIVDLCRVMRETPKPFLMSHRTHSHSHSSKRSPVEYLPMPIPPSDIYAKGDLPIMGPTPTWMKRRYTPAGVDASPLPRLPAFSLPPPREIISVPPQAKYLTVAPPKEDRILRDHVPRSKGSKPKAKPHSIKVVPESRPIALVTAHTPAPTSGGRSRGQGERSAPGTPYSPEPSPYISDPGMSRALPHALGMQAFPVRAERPWRHGG